MNNSKLRFKGFSFNYNPRTISIKHERNIVTHNSPLCNAVVQDLGIKPRIITGEGELFGNDVFAQFDSLSKTFRSLGEGLLSIPDIPPIKACFSSITITRTPTPQLLSYNFRFVEVTQ